MKKKITGLLMMCILLAVMPAACSAPEKAPESDAGGSGSMQSAENDDEEGAEEGMEEESIEMKMTIDGTEVNVSWEDNESVKALAKMAADGAVTIGTEPYGGFEQVGPIGATLPSGDTNIEAVAGDIVLYTGNQMVIFYGSNSWAYTRLGRITDKSDPELRELLGGDGVRVTITAE